MIFNIFRFKKELKEFKQFKKNFKFDMKQIEIIDEKAFCCNKPIKDENGKEIGCCDEWVDVGYKFHGPFSKALSNLFPYAFVFKGKKVRSIESVFQGIKLKDKKTQNLALKYWGIDSNTLKICSDFDWKSVQTLYWQGKPILRDSKEYDNFIDELYVSAIQNKLYRNALKNVSSPYLMHSIGEMDKQKTVFTRYEFEFMLNCLSNFLKQN